MGLTESVRVLVEPLVLDAGLELWDVEFSGGILRVLVDRPGGIDLDAVSAASLAISDALDASDPVGEDRYVLEVSSPGIERTLRTPAHFASQIGRLVAIKTAAPVDGARRLRGVLVAADADGITLEPEEAAADGFQVQLTYAQITKAQTVLVWGPAPRTAPGRRAGRSAQAASVAATPAPMKDFAP